MERFIQAGSEVDSETLIAAKKVRVGLGMADCSRACCCFLGGCMCIAATLILSWPWALYVYTCQHVIVATGAAFSRPRLTHTRSSDLHPS